jgi:NAD(P)-dependent dehydrogenase (short-subunit alcohol dehydrogenase family)
MPCSREEYGVSMSELTGKIALVTGAASGIGAACAERYAREGATVIATDIADDVEGIVVLDASDSSAWADLVKAITAEHGRLDLVHLNAGIRVGISDVRTLTDDDYLRVIAVNQHGVLYGLRATLPLLEKQGGSVLVTASRASLGPLANDLPYVMSKHAVTGLVRSVAADLETRGVSINALCPATVDTGFIAGAGRAQLERAGIAVMDADEVADGAMQILSGATTGQCFVQLPGARPEVFEFTPVPGR